MEKNIFENDLNSLISEEPIEVDGVGDGYPEELLFDNKEKEIDENNKSRKEIKETKADFIDTEDEDDPDLEENDDEKDEQNEKEEPSSDDTNSEKSSPLTPYAKLLKDEGILPNLELEKFDGTADGLKQAMVDEILSAVEIYKDSLPEKVKNLINNYEEGVPLDKLIEIDRQEFELSLIKEDKLAEDEELQKKIIKEYLKETTKFSDKKIEGMIQYYEDSGDLESEATNSLKELKSLVETKKESEKQLAQKRDQELVAQKKKELESLKKTVLESKEIISGIPLNDKVKNAVLTSMTTPAGQDQYGNPVNRIVAKRMEDPMDFEIKLHYLFEITKGFTDFSKLTVKGRKDSMKEFEQAVESLDNNEGKYINNTNQKSKAGSAAFLTAVQKTFNI